MLQEIYEIKEYQDEKGHLIKAKIVINPDTLEISKNPEDIKYMGFFRVQMPNGGIEIPFQFPQGMSLLQCFDNFDAEAKKTYEEMQQRATEKKIIVPNNNLAVPKNAGVFKI
jgi:hypothetical protein